MNKKEISEIKKLYTREGNIRTLAGCYVKADGEIISTFRKTFLSIEEEEIYKYIELLKKGFSGTIGKNINTYPVTDPTVQKSLLALRGSELKNDDMLKVFYENIIENYPETENFAILLINNTYDVISRGGDGFKNTDISEEVYNYIQIIICPVKLEKPGLIFNTEEDFFTQKNTRWELQAPVCSILYPSFESRTEDDGHVTCYSKNTSGAFDNLLSNVFSLNIQMSPEEQTVGFQTIMESVLESSEEKIQIIAQMQENIKEMVEESSGTENVELSAKEIGNILQNIGVSDESISIFEEEYESTFGDAAIPAENLFASKGVEVKTPDIVIKVKPDKKKNIQSRIIDGRKCLVIDIGQDEDIEVNGINL